MPRCILKEKPMSSLISAAPMVHLSINNVSHPMYLTRSSRPISFASAAQNLPTRQAATSKMMQLSPLTPVNGTLRVMLLPWECHRQFTPQIIIQMLRHTHRLLIIHSRGIHLHLPIMRTTVRHRSSHMRHRFSLASLISQVNLASLRLDDLCSHRGRVVWDSGLH